MAKGVRDTVVVGAIGKCWDFGGLLEGRDLRAAKI